MANEHDIEDEACGPAMLRLSPLQRRFVRAALDFPHGKDWQIAKAAGYSDFSHGSLRVRAHTNFHNEKVIAALQEEADKRLRSSAVLGASILAKIARTDGHKHQLRAAEALLNRIGFHEKTEHVMNVNHSDQTGRGMLDRITRLAAQLGVNPEQLLGVNTGPAPMLIEASAVHLPDGDLAIHCTMPKIKGEALK